MSQDAPQDSIMSALYRWLLGRPRPARIRALVAAVVAAVSAVTGAALVNLGDWAALVGSPAGIVLFAAGVSWWVTVATPAQADRVNLKARIEAPRRRFLTGVGAAVWIIFLLTVGRHLPDVVGGSLTVVVAATLVLFFRLSPDEAPVAAPSGDPGA